MYIICNIQIILNSNQPVQWKRGEAPDLAVGDHIDRDCQSDPAKEKRKVC